MHDARSPDRPASVRMSAGTRLPDSAGPLHGQNVLLSGASRGLGHALAHAFARRGANLLLVARSAKQLEDLCGELQRVARPEQSVALAADLSEPGAGARIIAHARGLWPRLDVLVNNAAVLGPIGACWENDWQEWLRTLQIDLLAPVELCRAAAPWMRAQAGGRIINLSGGGATTPRPRFSAYATAKAALVRFSEVLAAELADAGVCVNCVAPGAMNTDMAEEVRRAGPQRAGETEFGQAVKLAGQDAERATCRAVELILFLASPTGPRISGRLISAVWDPWESLPERSGDIAASDIYTLRRIVPQDRGQRWT